MGYEEGVGSLSTSLLGAYGALTLPPALAVDLGGLSLPYLL